MVSAIPSAPVLAARTSLLLATSLLAAPPAQAACDNLLPPPGAVSASPRPVLADDLLRLRDIGQPDSTMFNQESPLAPAPDGRRVAFILNRADPESNSYCRALVAVNVMGARDPVILDRGGELITGGGAARGVQGSTGYPVLLTPLWSSDGQWIAYLRRDKGVTQLWRARSDGSSAQAVTRSPVDVERFAWDRDQHRLIYAATPALVAAARDIDREGERGWLNDDRIVPSYGARPMPSGLLPQDIVSLDPDTGEARPANEAEKQGLMDGQIGLPMALAPDGRRATVEHETRNPYSPLRIIVHDGSGRAIPCTARDCTGYIYKMWWDGDGRSLIVLRREGWNKGQMGLLRWRPDKAQFERILLTDDVLQGCLHLGGSLICTAENSTTPRHIAAIDLKTGRTSLVYDPNPEFRALRLGSVRRLIWRNDIGFPAWGDLVLPPDYKPGMKLPLIITQYHSNGFLRGGTGDEYPIFAFAARGFAVLSFERPPPVGSDRADLHSSDEVDAAVFKDLAERKSIFSAIMTGLKQVIDLGVVDPARVGITGLSDGATSTRYALVNSRSFAAASISTCCTDTNAVMTGGGVAFADTMHKLGMPLTIDHDEAFWAPLSMSLSARRMDRPLLMQLADREMALSLETFTALREAGQPVEMYVFPDEHHNKVQPRHRQAIYERNLDWFSFWLQGKVDPDPAKAEQFKRWQAMKAKREEKHSAS